MSEFRVSGAGPLHGRVSVPSDKSISHRALILSALAVGQTRVENLLESETTQATVDCLRGLGVEIDQVALGTLLVGGCGPRGLQEPRDPLFCRGSGTTMRLLAGVCAGQPFLSILDGTPALKRRPMGRVVEPLRRMGAQVLGRSGDQLPPLAIRGGNLRGIDYALPVASAQVKSALLLAGLFADGPTALREPAPSRDHTERMMSAFGVEVERASSTQVRITPGELRTRGRLAIPGDFSSAAFLLVAALLAPGSDLLLQGTGLNPTRTGLLDALIEMGARFEVENPREENGEPVGDVRVQAAGELVSGEVSGDLVPRMIDEFPIFAVAATQARGETRVRDAAELRVKESDRIAALTQELRRLGAQIEPHDDGFTIAGPARLRGARVSAHGDHRLAMSLAVAGLLAEGETVIDGWECVADSFPGFERLLSRLEAGG